MPQEALVQVEVKPVRSAHTEKPEWFAAWSSATTRYTLPKRSMTKLYACFRRTYSRSDSPMPLQNAVFPRFKGGLPALGSVENHARRLPSDARLAPSAGNAR